MSRGPIATPLIDQAAGNERRGGRIRTREPEHPMPRGDRLSNDGEADEAGRAGDEDPH